MASPTLGDTLLNSATLQDIRSHFPEAHLVFFAAPASVAAAKLLPSLDDIVELDLKNPLRAIRALREYKLDVLFDFTQWQRLTAFYAALSGAKYRVGFRSERQHRHWNYDLIVDHARTLHELENYRNLVRVFGVNPQAEPFLNVPHVIDREEGPHVIVFHPWASGERGVLREWPTERWIELGYRLADTDTVFVITGAPAEQGKTEALCTKFKEAGLNARAYIGRDGLASLGRVLRSSDLVVSVNTGIMHLAAIVGAPTVGLNGPTASHRWGPRGARTASVEPRGGGGFLHFGFEFDGYPTDSMQRIAVDDVVEAAGKLSPSLVRASTSNNHSKAIQEIA